MSVDSLYIRGFDLHQWYRWPFAQRGLTRSPECASEDEAEWILEQALIGCWHLTLVTKWQFEAFMAPQFLRYMQAYINTNTSRSDDASIDLIAFVHVELMISFTRREHWTSSATIAEAAVERHNSSHRRSDRSFLMKRVELARSVRTAMRQEREFPEHHPACNLPRHYQFTPECVFGQQGFNTNDKKNKAGNAFGGCKKSIGEWAKTNWQLATNCMKSIDLYQHTSTGRHY